MLKIRSKTISVYTAIVAFNFTLVMLAGCGQPQETPGEEIIKGALGPEIETKLESIIKDVIEAYELPGLAIGIVKDSKIAYVRGFGYKNIDTRASITAKTLFHMASISKPFVATAIMQLVEQGKIDLDAPVTEYLPYFELNDPRYKEITIQKMLSHVSGMPDVADYEWDNPVYDDGALERYVRSLKKLKMHFAPGERFAYSNMAFECLGDVIAKVSGMSFADYEKEHILNPSGMKESTFLKPPELPDNWAAGHLRSLRTVVWDGYPYNRMHGPSSTLHSNAVEMCNWAITNINKGSFRGSQILNPSSYDVLWKKWIEIGKEGSGNAIGLSWFLGEYRGEKRVSHGGGDVGFNTYLTILPEKAMAVVVLCNFIPAPVGYVSEAALNLLLGFEPKTLIPPVHIAIGKTLAENGIEAAVAQWNKMKEKQDPGYEIDLQQFYTLMRSILELDRVEDAQILAQFLLEILTDQQIKNIMGIVESHIRRHPDNLAGPAVIDILSR